MSTKTKSRSRSTASAAASASPATISTPVNVSTLLAAASALPVSIRSNSGKTSVLLPYLDVVTLLKRDKKQSAREIATFLAGQGIKITQFGVAAFLKAQKLTTPRATKTVAPAAESTASAS